MGDWQRLVAAVRTHGLGLPSKQQPLHTAVAADQLGGDATDLRLVTRRYQELLQEQPTDPLLWTRWLSLHLDTGRWTRHDFLEQWQAACERLGPNRHQHAELLHLQVGLRLYGQPDTHAVLDDLPDACLQASQVLQALRRHWQLMQLRRRHHAPWIPHWRVRARWWQQGPLLLPDHHQGQPLTRWGVGRLRITRAPRGGPVVSAELQGQLFDLHSQLHGVPPDLRQVRTSLPPQQAQQLVPGSCLELGWYGPSYTDVLLLRPCWSELNPTDTELPPPDLPAQRWARACWPGLPMDAERAAARWARDWD